MIKQKQIRLGNLDCRPFDPTRHGILSGLYSTITGLFKKKRLTETTIEELPKKKYVPAKTVEDLSKRAKIMRQAKEKYRREQIKQLEKKIKQGTPLKEMEEKLKRLGETIARQRRLAQTQKISPVQRRKVLAMKRGLKMIYPMIPSQAVVATYKYSEGKRKRGRPKGSYKYPGGVYAWRKAQRRLKAMQKLEARQRQYEQHISRMMQMQPQYASQYAQYVTEIPGVREVQETEPQKRPMTTFKGYGGRAYPPVETRPLQPSKVTVPQGYVEYVDMFTGERKIKQLPPSERWIAGG